MANLEDKFRWLKEILEEKPKRFADYYKEDIANYLDIEETNSIDLEDLLGDKFDKFLECKNKDDIQEFVNDITSHIVMKVQIEEIIENYFSL